MKGNLDIIRINKKFEIKTLDLLWFIVIPIININYVIANIISKNGHDLTIALDNVIKFNEYFIIPYIYWYIYVVLGFIFILIRSREDYIRVFLSFFIGMSICYIVYYIYPTEITRPILYGKNIFEKIVSIIYFMDKPVNCFPSLHVLTTYFLMRYTKYKDSKRIFYYTQITGVLIILSTVFIKQHFVLDIIGAIFICEIVIYFIKKISDNKINAILNIPYKLKNKLSKKFNNKIKAKEIKNKEEVKNKI